ncbi:Protein of unknown function [Pyronema omphalodes CBS 100304]|uniref:Uncharacterized protein n=1 Tax=Pyronema omphalodes (strain CBS 100304) TaxID=1076935 RepID=U4LPC0_PYROM|nr:Protein of unknown function [Pyronema omphalodes CBS 100304]
MGLVFRNCREFGISCLASVTVAISSLLWICMREPQQPVQGLAMHPTLTAPSLVCESLDRRS